MIPVPTGTPAETVSFALDMIEHCRVSASNRYAYCSLMNVIAETGRQDGTKSLLNLLYKHLERTAAHMFSAVDLRFKVGFENEYPKLISAQGKVAANTLMRQWQRNNTDIHFGRGVFESLKYGACVHKQWVQLEYGRGAYYDKLVMPWQFGVYNESITEIGMQPALCETTQITMPEVWRRIFHLPNARELFNRISSHCMSGTQEMAPQSYFHQVLSTSQLNTSGTNTANRPGGIIQLNNNPNYSIMGPVVSAPMVKVHELWVKDDLDYTTIILIEPDILIAPLVKKANLLSANSQLQPYRVIRPNEVTDWFWGRSELVDLIEPQGLLADWCDDIRRLFGLQVDKILAFVGENGIVDESYAQFRGAGYVNLAQGSSVEDLTPKIPNESIPMLKFLIESINTLSGFPPIMQGQGEEGVRAGSHANTLMKTASPSLRDRALLVERQCAMAADLSLKIRGAKDYEFKWVNGETPEAAEDSKFLLSQLPADWHVIVDSHSSSPIFADENTQLVFAGMKAGLVDGEYVIDNVPLPDKAAAKTSFREKTARHAQEMQQLAAAHPEFVAKAESKKISSVLGGKAAA